MLLSAGIAGSQYAQQYFCRWHTEASNPSFPPFQKVAWPPTSLRKQTWIKNSEQISTYAHWKWEKSAFSSLKALVSSSEETTDVLISDFQPPELWENKFLCLSCPVCTTSLWQPQQTNTIILFQGKAVVKRLHFKLINIFSSFILNMMTSKWFPGDTEKKTYMTSNLSGVKGQV